LREDFCAIEKRDQNRKGRKNKMPRVGKKGVGKKIASDMQVKVVRHW